MKMSYSLGGYDRGECLKSVESYDPGTNLWAALAPLKEARGRFNIAVVLGNVYAVGGSNGSTELSTVEKFDPQMHKWTRVSNLPIARSNAGKCRKMQEHWGLIKKSKLWTCWFFKCLVDKATTIPWVGIFIMSNPDRTQKNCRHLKTRGTKAMF